MITKFSGQIDSFTKSSVIIENGGIYFEISIPPVQLVQIQETHRPGDSILLHTRYYIEGGIAMSNLIPRLLGFMEESDREFFDVFTTVKGLGEKKALQTMTIPIPVISQAIESGDVFTLKKLPGIGGRMADKIVAELRGKVTKYASSSDLSYDKGVSQKTQGFEEDAYEVLISQLGYRRDEAENLIRKAISEDTSIDSVEKLLQSIFVHNADMRD